MEQVVFKIGEVAARLGLIDKNNNTLRGWTEEFGPFLSASANPPAGQPRRYTARDMQTLTAVRNYRTNHLSYEEIRERLRAGELDVTDGEDVDDERDEAFLSTSQSLSSLMPMDAVLAPLAASIEEWRRLAEEYRTRLERREARITLLEERLDELYGRFDAATASLDRKQETTDVPSTVLEYEHDVVEPSRPVEADSTSRKESVVLPDQTADRARVDEREFIDAASRMDSQWGESEPAPALFPLPTSGPPPSSGLSAEGNLTGSPGAPRNPTVEEGRGQRRARRGWWFGRGAHRA